MSDPLTRVCAILGVGPGNGLSFAKKFSAEGYSVALCSRNGAKMSEYADGLANAHGYSCDVTDTNSLKKTVAAIGRDLGPVDTLIFNAGSANWGTIDQLDADALELGFAVNASGLFRAAQCVLPDMRQNNRGNIIVVGAGGSAARSTRNHCIRSRQSGAEINCAIPCSPARARKYPCVIPCPGRCRRSGNNNAADARQATGVLPRGRRRGRCGLYARHPRPTSWTFELDLRPYSESW